MSEIITLSTSQTANHLITHLYNNQESHIPYKKDFDVKYDNLSFLSQNKINGRTNYSPRALIYDVRNGFGALGRYEYYSLEQHNELSGYEVINTGNKVEKNEYQKALDKGGAPGDLTTSNTKYWTDYNKLIYRPMSLMSLESWEQNDGRIINKFTPSMEFNHFVTGQEEYKIKEEETSDGFRKLLEESDYFDGIQLFTQLDNGWSGFTNEMLTSIKDEFFNYTSNNKFNIWVWGALKQQSLNYFEKLTRIKSLVEFSKSSSLLLPLKCPSVLPLTTWETTGAMSVAVNSMWELVSTKVSNMKDIEMKILGDNFDRNIVNHITLKEIKDLSVGKLSLYDLEDKKDLDLGFNKVSNHKFSTVSIINQWDKEVVNSVESKSNHNFFSKNDLLDITKIDTFPDVIPFTKGYTEFSVDSSIKYDLDMYIKFAKTSRNLDMFIGDKEDLVNDLYNLKSSYSSGPEFDDDSDDYDD